MPLVKSSDQGAFRENVKKEITEGGKPRAQALAIAYSVQRDALKHGERKEGSVKRNAKRSR